jgi:hypothetical protein
MKIQNWPLLLLAIEHIIRHADQYDQGSWRSDCGTYRCLAGWVAFFAGWRDVTSSNVPNGYFLGLNRTGRDDDSLLVQVEDAALMALELDTDIFGTSTDEEFRYTAMSDFADSLFAGGLDMLDILSAVRDLAKADGVTPTPLIIEEMLSYGIVNNRDVF